MAHRILFKFFKISAFALSIIIILSVFLGGSMYLGASIMLSKDLKLQKERLNNLRNNDYEPINEQDFCAFPLSLNPKINCLQVLATHNSYKKKMPSLFYGVGRAFSAVTKSPMHKQYHHNSLTDQLNKGVRGLELDLRYQHDKFIVYHNPIYDQRTNNPDWEKTLEELLLWSLNNPGHIMVNVIIEIKDDALFLNPSRKKINEELLRELDFGIKRILGEHKLVTPRFLIGDYHSLVDMRQNNGWPKLSRVKGKFMFLLHQHSTLTDKYIALDPTMKTQAMIPLIEYAQIDRYKEYAAVLLYNDPNKDEIASLVSNNYIDRSRMDIDVIYDGQRRLDALDSGAQILTTDMEYGRILPKNDYDAFLEDNFTVRLNPVAVY